MSMIRLLSAATLCLVVLAGCASTAETTAIAPCSGSCQTHEDGYAWAQSGNLTEAAWCTRGDYSAAFVRGCRDAVEDYAQLRPAQQGWGR